MVLTFYGLIGYKLLYLTRQEQFSLFNTVTVLHKSLQPRFGFFLPNKGLTVKF